jgi:hypothetical protein
MLFDLRGRGRRRTVQVIYLGLALLMGGGLVLFGVGGNVQGGLLDAFRENSGSANDAIEKRVEDVQKAVKARPTDPAAWAQLAEAQYQLAGVSDGFNEQTGQFTGESREKLVEAERAWDRHLQLVGEKGKPNANTAAIMRNVFSPSGLNKPAKAVIAQEIVIDSKPNPGFGDYAQLAVLAYNAGQTRKGDLAKAKAIELAPKGQKQAIKQSIEEASQAKASAPPTTTTG